MEINNNLVETTTTTTTKMTKLLGRAKMAVLDCYYLATRIDKFILFQFPRFNTSVNNSHAFKTKTLP